MFGRAVASQQRAFHIAIDRVDIDDRPVAPLLEMAKRDQRPVNHTPISGLEYLEMIGKFEIGNRSVITDTRMIDPHNYLFVERSKMNALGVPLI